MLGTKCLGSCGKILGLATFVLIAFESQARAANHFSFNGSLFYQDHVAISENAQTTTGDLDVALSGGYLMGSGLYLGLIYVRDKAETSTATGNNTIIASSYGATLGYMKKGSIALAASYLLNPSSEAKVTSTNSGQSSSQTLKGGTGTFLEIGFPLAVNSSFCIGPLLAQMNMTYKKVDTTTDGIIVSDSLTGTWSDKWTRLAFGVWYDL